MLSEIVKRLDLTRCLEVVVLCSYESWVHCTVIGIASTLIPTRYSAGIFSQPTVSVEKMRKKLQSFFDRLECPDWRSPVRTCKALSRIPPTLKSSKKRKKKPEPCKRECRAIPIRRATRRELGRAYRKQRSRGLQRNSSITVQVSCCYRRS